MIQIVVPQDAQARRLPFYLAMEEWAARELPPKEYFFTWRVNPTVICGRNQDISAELDMNFCRERGIDVVRRKSGGGAVFADRDNLMISYISDSGDVESTFAHYTTKLVRLLRDFGINCNTSGRNDIMIEGKKVSGNAFYRLGERSIVHGTLLFDTNPELMHGALTPSRSKLESKRVKSVESRVTTIHEHLPFVTIETFVNYIQYVLDDEKQILTQKQVAEIEAIASEYDDPQWLAVGGHMRHGHMENEAEVRIDGIGEFCVHSVLSGEWIQHIDLTGDFFHLTDVQPLLDSLVGVHATREDLVEALGSVHVDACIPGLDNGKFADIIAQSF